MTVRDKQVTQT